MSKLDKPFNILYKHSKNNNYDIIFGEEKIQYNVLNHVFTIFFDTEYKIYKLLITIRYLKHSSYKILYFDDHVKLCDKVLQTIDEHVMHEALI